MKNKGLRIGALVPAEEIVCDIQIPAYAGMTASCFLCRQVDSCLRRNDDEVLNWNDSELVNYFGSYRHSPVEGNLKVTLFKASYTINNYSSQHSDSCLRRNDGELLFFCRQVESLYC